MLKADLHIHTNFSFDCHMTADEIIARCLKAGINCIAITDHGTVEGGLLVQKKAPFKVIVGEEVRTAEGEVMGLFLKQTVPNGLPLVETAKLIKAQGGILGVPHPFDPFRGLKKAKQNLESLVNYLDLLEVFNSRSLILDGSGKARKFCLEHKLPGSAGSDAHTLGEIGMSYVEMEDFSTPASFLTSLSHGQIKGKKSNPLVHFRTFNHRRLRGLFNSRQA